MLRLPHRCGSQLLPYRPFVSVNYREIITSLVSHERRALPAHFYLFMDGSPRFTSDSSCFFWNCNCPFCWPSCVLFVVYNLIVSRVSRGVPSASALKPTYPVRRVLQFFAIDLLDAEGNPLFGFAACGVLVYFDSETSWLMSGDSKHIFADASEW